MSRAASGSLLVRQGKGASAAGLALLAHRGPSGRGTLERAGWLTRGAAGSGPLSASVCGRLSERCRSLLVLASGALGGTDAVKEAGLVGVKTNSA